MSTLDEWLSTDHGKETFDLLSLWTTLTADVAISRQALQQATPFARRQYIRTVIAKVEGFTAMLKRLTASSPGAESLTAAERLLLLEQTPVLDDKGRPELLKQFPRLEVSLRFALRMYARVNGVDYDLPVGDHEWDDLCRAIKTRNRLMHPKSDKDLDVTNEEVADAHTGESWLGEKHRALQELILDKQAYDSGMSAEEVKRFREFRRTLGVSEPVADGPAA